MTNEADEVMVMIERATITRRAEESARFAWVSSVPVHGNEDLMALISTNVKNPMMWDRPHLIQPQLSIVQKAASNGATPATADEPDAVMDTMIVNGEPAKVRRPRKSSSNGNGASAADKPPYSYHAFREDGTAPGLCAECHKRQNDAGHELAPWPAEDKPLPHAFRRQGRSNSCGWCHLGIASELHIEDAEVPSFEEEAPSAVESLTGTLLAGIEDDALPAAEAVAVGEGA